MTAQRAKQKNQMCDQTRAEQRQTHTAPQVSVSTNTAYPSAYASLVGARHRPFQCLIPRRTRSDAAL